MASINKVILIGNLGKDPELRRTPNGASVVSFPLATKDRWKDKDGERQDRTEWHNIVAWNKLADLANQYLKKGRAAYVEGRIATRSWDDKDGNKRYKTEIVANQIQFLGSSSASASDTSSSVPETENNDIADSVREPDPVVEDDLPF